MCEKITYAAAICFFLVLSHGCGNPAERSERRQRIERQAEDHIKRGKIFEKRREFDKAIAEFSKPIVEITEAVRLKRIDIDDPGGVGGFCQATYERGLTYFCKYRDSWSDDDAHKAITDLNWYSENLDDGPAYFTLGELYFLMYSFHKDEKDSVSKYLDVSIKYYLKALRVEFLEDEQKRQYEMGLNFAVVTKNSLEKR